ncbi:MAG: ADP-forming succinate--CoA ligase subunit beta [Candidatus Thermoplasmatota archaeon]|jgi:succinyl-CoA synthetase beta subunit|nr:ADP-forming succinate--CoA ligase subunit beta [Candidatus Thermoplasmatota archaeon]MEC7406598.1 ADP-forming succinate--CoA ligase subunit beta [Candidatus Thermoplasmatota archaeon]MEC7410732.1 ADP-forming succinate--CoA ligase subunit beta [Candidatus Thermoplasmatota archaeon]MEC9136648.1 ADP-forming succinate--CoA ligase subunit beta [Candidatus Thermoplasmatota archaeon]MEC9146855.1 ADP-forming succinate--CoA ligase subunit beta [Candidatus Thermoplasmatota archaeon]|tara:strand:- start:4034 stop:5242 length:1209 start_codon:yes stop_codon:yes gene_type:complete
MNIHEYQAKEMFREFGVNVLEGVHCKSVDEAIEAYDSLGSKIVAVKSQIHAGGRGKGILYDPDSGEEVMKGGVKIAFSREDVLEFSKNICGNKLVTKQTGPSGKIVTNMYVEAGCDIDHEFYLAILVDRDRKSVLVMASTEGGVDIEEVAEKTPEAIHKIWADPSSGLAVEDCESLSKSLGITGDSAKELTNMLGSLYRMFLERDCSMIEINPLVRTKDGIMIALDAKVSLDENANFRHPWREEVRDLSEEEDVEIRANDLGLSYVKLDGNIGCLVNGAGLAMASMDVIKLYGGEPANFLDIGGGATLESITAAFQIILEDENVEGILVNIFGGIIRCDMVARSVIEASKEIGLDVPLVVRFSGTNHEEGKAILDGSDISIHTVNSLSEGARKIVECIGGGN